MMWNRIIKRSDAIIGLFKALINAKCYTLIIQETGKLTAIYHNASNQDDLISLLAHTAKELNEARMLTDSLKNELGIKGADD